MHAGSLGIRGGFGIYLGKTARSDEHYVWTEGGKVGRRRTIKPKPEPDIWEARLSRAFRAGESAWEKYQGRITHVERTPRLHPMPKNRWWVVLRGCDGQRGLYNRWEAALAVVQASIDSGAAPRASAMASRTQGR